MTINYTTYDVRRAQESINCNTERCTVMVKADEQSSQLFLYAQVIDICHALVETQDSIKPTRVNFLFVRWLTPDPSYSAGWKHRRLDRIRFVSHADPRLDNFGFLDPTEVIRACHLIPCFSMGMTDVYLGPSIARSASDAKKEGHGAYIEKDGVVSAKPRTKRKLKTPETQHQQKTENQDYAYYFVNRYVTN